MEEESQRTFCVK
uniref:Uncharacterized protein n=1 Tax=Rhizophora mucronata TaxID=61149 RepID=A0A2P2MDX8_RHIMU